MRRFCGLLRRGYAEIGAICAPRDCPQHRVPVEHSAAGAGRGPDFPGGCSQMSSFRPAHTHLARRACTHSPRGAHAAPCRRRRIARVHHAKDRWRNIFLIAAVVKGAARGRVPGDGWDLEFGFGLESGGCRKVGAGRRGPPRDQNPRPGRGAGPAACGRHRSPAATCSMSSQLASALRMLPPTSARKVS